MTGKILIAIAVLTLAVIAGCRTTTIYVQQKTVVMGPYLSVDTTILVEPAASQDG
jgi:hypothetical protein